MIYVIAVLSVFIIFFIGYGSGVLDREYSIKNLDLTKKCPICNKVLTLSISVSKNGHEISLEKWQDIDRTYTTNEQQLDTLLDCMFGQFMTANRGQ